MKKIGVFIIAVLLGLLSQISVSEGALTINGDGSWGDFTAELIWENPKLTINITNTSDPINGGYITAFVYNTPSSINNLSLYETTDLDFNLLFDIDKVKAEPYGKFDVGATIGNNFTGGSKPYEGIDIGVTKTFMFTFLGTDLDILDENDFLTPSLPQGNSGTESFLVRFQGFNNEESDKVPGVTTTPEPSSVVILGSGLLGLLIMYRKTIRK